MSPTRSDHGPDRDSTAWAELTKLVQEATGLGWGPAGQARLRSGVQERLNSLGLAYPADYLAVLRDQPEEWLRFYPRLADPSTSFFNHPAQWIALPELLRNLTGRPSQRTLNLLSAGCSSGAEAYRLAMTVVESGLVNKGWQVNIHGLDLSPAALEKVHRAEYPNREVVGLGRGRLSRWFRPKGRYYQLRDNLKNMVVAGQGNLLTPEQWPWPTPEEGWDLILLRNVLVDLSPEAGERLNQLLAGIMAPEGIVLTAPGEGLAYAFEAFTAERRGPVIFYRRRRGRMKVNPGPAPRKARIGAVNPDPPRADRPDQRRLRALRAGIRILKEKSPDLAWPHWRESLELAAEKDEICVPALGLAARTNLRLGRPAEARALIRQILDFAGDRSWAHRLLADAWADSGNDDEARREMKLHQALIAAYPQLPDDPFYELDQGEESIGV